MKATGVTLIELLVVITVIAVLMGILLPVVHVIRQEGNAAVCGSNLKQLCLALTTYDQQNGTFPYGFDDLTYGPITPPGGYVGNAAYDQMGGWWFHFLVRSLGEDFDTGTVLWCPARCISDPGPKANVLCGNYGVNRAICKDAQGVSSSEFVGKPLGAYQIRPAASTLLISDTGYSLISWRGATDAPSQSFENPMRESAFYIPGLWINNERSLFPGHEDDATGGRHPNKSVNVGFADGHVNRLNADDLLVEEANGNYHNRSPLWLPK